MFFEGAELPYVSDGVRRDFICGFDSQDDREVTQVPGAPIDDWSYVYLGYVIENQAQLELFASVYNRIVAEGGDFTQDIKVGPGEGNCGTDTIYRLRSGEKLIALLPCLREKLETIPLVIEWPENHRGPVARVVTLALDSPEKTPDSRVKALKYPGEWPMTEEAMAVLRELDALEGEP